MNTPNLSFRSLTVRFALMLAVVAVVVFGLVGGFLYHALGEELENRDDQDVISKVRVVRGLLEERDSIRDLETDNAIFTHTASTADKLLLILKDKHGRVVFSHNAEFEPPPLPVVPFEEIPTDAAIRTFFVDGVSGRALSAVGALSNREKITIVVARRGFRREALLEHYRYDIFGAAALGALAISVIGFVLIRQVLLPLKRVASRASSVNARSLGSPLDIKEVPKEIEELVVAFNHMLARLNESFQRLSQFSGDLAHDLRTPINNLLVQTQVALAQERTIEEYQALMISNIEEYERLKRMSESMLFLARADNGQITVDKKLLDCRTELMRVAEYFEGVAEDKEVVIEVTATGQMFVNSMLLYRALGNLVSNAIRYTEPGGTIFIEAALRGEYTVISVKNPGRGISAADLPRIFDRFYRADVARADSGSSAGLGLSIVKSIMRLHDGDVVAHSVEQGWTEFLLTFPAPPADA